MNSLSGFIKLHRKLVAWGWYQDYVVKDVFLHLLLTANFKRTEWQGQTLEEGQVVIGYQKLADELGFGVRRVRTAIDKLKSTNEVTTKSTNKFTIITIVNWREYQSGEADTDTQTDTHFDKRPTNNRQTTDKQLTNDRQQRKNVKNIKNVKNGKKREGALTAHGEFKNVFLTDSEVNKLRQLYPSHYAAKIDRLSRYIENHKEWTTLNHYAKLIDWLEEDVEKPGEVVNGTQRGYDIDDLEKINTLDFIE